MPGIRQAIVIDLPRRRLGIALQRATRRPGCAQGHYGQALVMSRKWKAALAPWLAGIPLRTGFAGEVRFGLLNDVRFGERKLPRMIDQMGALALPKDAQPAGGMAAARIEGAGGRGRRAGATRQGLAADDRTHRHAVARRGRRRQGLAGRPLRRNWRARSPRTAHRSGSWADRTRRRSQNRSRDAAGKRVRDLTGNDLRNAILALAAADVAVTNDSGLMHVSAAIGTPTVAIFGPTSPWHWKPLNPIAAILEPPGDEAARQARAQIEGNDAVGHRRTADVAVETVLAAVREVIQKPR